MSKQDNSSIALQNSLNGKKILFIGVDFYDYEVVIREALEKRGAIVCYCSSKVSTLKSRLAKRLGSTFESGVKDKIRYRRLSNATKNNDVVFVIKGAELNRRDLNLIKESNPNAVFKLYLWDSLSNHNNISLLFEHFSDIWSFDRLDCLANPKLKFRPTFYRGRVADKVNITANSAETLAANSIDKKYAVTFVGRIYGERFEVAKRLRDQLEECNREYFIKFFMELPDYIIARYIKRSLSKKDSELITTKKVPFNLYNEAVRNSSVLLDIGHVKHSGLTMRIFDALAARCYIVTNNSDIKNYSDIPSSLYTIYNKDINLNELLLLGTDHLSSLNLDNYSLDSFINELFS